LNRLLADVHGRKCEVVLVWKLDRWGRSLRHLVNSLAELEARGVAFVSRKEQSWPFASRRTPYVPGYRRNGGVWAGSYPRRSKGRHAKRSCEGTTDWGAAPDSAVAWVPVDHRRCLSMWRNKSAVARQEIWYFPGDRSAMCQCVSKTS